MNSPNSREVLIQKYTRRIFSLDIRSLAFMRMGIGIIILIDLFNRTPDLTAHYTDLGVLPRSLLSPYLQSTWKYSIYMIDGSWIVAAILFFFTCFLAVLLILGWKTRLVTILLFLLIISLHSRNPFVLNGGDMLLRILLFWGIFLPWNRTFALDSYIKFKKVKNTVVSLTTTAFIIQIAIIYWFSALSKTGDTWRIDGTAIYFALSFQELSTHVGSLLLQFPQILKLMTFGVLFYEGLAPFLFFIPSRHEVIRAIAVCGLIMLHLGIGLTLNLGLFSIVCMVMLSSLLPSIVWDTLPFISNSLNMFFSFIFLTIKRYTLKKPLTVSIFSSLNISKRHQSNLFRLRDIFLVILIIFITILNIVSLLHINTFLTRTITKIASFAGIRQEWSFFSPDPPRYSRWFEINGKLSNGKSIPLLNTYENSDTSREYQKTRWTFYLSTITLTPYRQFLIGFTNYLCRQWSLNHSQSQKLQNISISQYTKPSGFGYDQQLIKSTSIFKADCK